MRQWTSRPSGIKSFNCKYRKIGSDVINKKKMRYGSYHHQKLANNVGKYLSIPNIVLYCEITCFW